MNNRSGVTYAAIQEQLKKEDQAFQAQMVRIEIKEESIPTDFFADMHLTTK